MANLGKLEGSPWHVERFQRKEGDDRRHSHRCLNYNKSDGHCSYYCAKCYGAAHCNQYSEKNVMRDNLGPQKMEKKVVGAVAFEGVKEIKIAA